MKKILTSCCCTIAFAGLAQSDIYKGGNGDGRSAGNYLQNSASFWVGGDGDGHSTNKYIQNSTSFWKGDVGDGHATANYKQASTSFWLGGDGDGHAQKSYTQASISFWKGGAGDGWASSYLPQQALPVTWLSFEASKWQDKYSRLTWKTATETNTKSFEVERGHDATHFVKIASVNAAGNSTSAKEYSLNDMQPAAGLNYYRIKQIDVNGRFTYSPARLVRFDAIAAQQLRIYPNPAKAFINVEMPETMQKENTIINVIDFSGKVVDQIKVNAGSNSFIRLNVSVLARGSYIVHVVSATKTAATQIVLQ